LRQTPFLTNATLFNLPALPKRFMVLGAGPISLEMAQAFRRFGSEAPWDEKGWF
jgi:pyruvate/2-oxoglutarate dehydrogenase complex dihydrolipoamide dehydrogenase (E3) component